MFITLINYFAVLLSLGTTAGVVVHDVKIDKATMAALAMPLHGGHAESSKAPLEVTLHTHVERGSVA